MAVYCSFPVTVTKELSSTQLVGACLKSLSKRRKKWVLYTLFLTQAVLDNITSSKRRQTPAENACAPAVQMWTLSSQEATCCVGAFLSPNGTSAWLHRSDSALTQVGSGYQRRSGLDFEHRRNEAGVSVSTYGDVPLLQQLNTNRVSLSWF